MANATAKALADDLLSWIKGVTFPAAPANLYIGLFSTTPTANTGSGTEVSGSSYARQTVASSAWSAISQNADTIHDQISNSNAITFPAVTTSSYTVTGIGIWDASSAGNLLFYQAVTSQAVSVGNQYQVAAAALIVEV
ncbi:MAG: hypothetical protein KGH75_00785 [Rhodospirillales bacterium]|nr:hypothetical protein [Rhodospirillales bacterium]